MRPILRSEKSLISGKSFFKSHASRGMTPAPQPSRCWRPEIKRPISQYNKISSRLTVRFAFLSGANTCFDVLEQMWIIRGQICAHFPFSNFSSASVSSMVGRLDFKFSGSARVRKIRAPVRGQPRLLFRFLHQN